MARILVWVQHLWGAGHVARALAIGGALTDAGHEVMLALGGAPTGLPVPPGVGTTQLPPLMTEDERYRRLVTPDGREVDDTYWAARRTRLLALYDAVRPDIVLVEHFPFGRRKLAGEIRALIDRARGAAHAPLVVASVRDICEPPSKAHKADQQLEWARTLFDRVLVHADPSLIRLEHSLPHVGALHAHLVYTGFVARPAALDFEGRRDGGVLVVPGSGRGGGPLLDLALTAYDLGAGPGRTWTLVAGPYLEPAALSAFEGRLAEKTRPGLTFVRQDPHVTRRLPGASLIVARCGYNMTWESLSQGRRFVAMPEASSREQKLRAGLLAQYGMATVPSGNPPSAEDLACCIDRALASEPTGLKLRFDGAARTARILTRALETGGQDWTVLN